MSWFKRLRTFTEEEDILADDFEAEFDGIADALNALFKVDIASASKDLTLSGAYQDVPGTEREVTPAVPSKLLVVAIFDLETYSAIKFENPCKGILNLDGVDQLRAARLSIKDAAELSESMTLRAPATVLYSLSLSAGAHSVKMRAKREGAAEGLKCYAEGTHFLYLLIPNPEP